MLCGNVSFQMTVPSNVTYDLSVSFVLQHNHGYDVHNALIIRTLMFTYKCLKLNIYVFYEDLYCGHCLEFRKL